MSRAAAAAGLAAVMILPASLASADTFTPVVLSVSIAPVARLHKPLAVKVRVTADAGVLDTATAPLRIRIKLASECGGEFAGTPGAVLLDKRLSPQPTTGHAYAATARGSGRPLAYGAQTVCVFLEEQGDNRQFATDTSNQVDVSRTCTAAAARFDAAGRVLARARRRRRGVAHAHRIAAADQRRARRACGSGVLL